MNDPYKVLGVSPTDSDEKIKTAYRKLVKKYHPDNYGKSPLSDLADEKMAEINSAYDEIMNQRRGGGTSYGYNNGYSGNSSGYSQNAGYSGSYSGNADYNEVRRLINARDVARADDILNSVDPSQRNAEWYYLKGSVCYTKGWMNEAYDYFTTASNMEPNNTEYAAAKSRMSRNARGYMNGNPNGQYNTNPNATGCSGCDMCMGLLCADSCCDCMGGDLISCC